MLSVYIHFPWCRHRCSYCDFPIAVAGGGEIPHERYADAVIAELRARSGDFGDGATLDTIYVGGGTPSLWRPAALGRVMAAVRELFPGNPREVTLEANPVDCTPEGLAQWRELGIDRLSVGVQSFRAGDLVTLGRDHRMGDGEEALAAITAAGFASFSLDLILSIPGAGPDPGLDRAVAAAAPHLSIYELTVEARTPLARAVERGDLVPVSDEEAAERYLDVHRRLTAAGYEHYEVSSFARPGHHSRHNSRYWQLEPYLGVGNGAASLEVLGDGSGRRRTNVRAVGRYLAGGPDQVAEVEVVGPAEMARDRVWLGLRCSHGVGADDVPPPVTDWLLEHHLAEHVDGRIRPTIRGFLHHDGIARRVVGSLG